VLLTASSDGFSILVPLGVGIALAFLLYRTVTIRNIQVVLKKSILGILEKK
jgi:hypothetical protein